MFKRRESFRLTSYCDADYVGDKVERKRTSGSYHFIGGNLVTWICKKQGSTSLSTIQAEYMSATSFCAQLLWIKNQFEDYSIYESKIPIFCDNKVVITLSKNPALHSKEKHIEIKNHFYKRLCLKWDNGLVATCPFVGERRRGSRVRFPKEERCAESPPMFICGKCRKNRRKPVKMKILSSGVVFTFEASHVCLKGQQPIF